MEPCPLETDCRRINVNGFSQCMHPGWFLDNDRRCDVRTALSTKKAVAVTNAVTGVVTSVVTIGKKQTKIALIRDLFKTGTTLKQAIHLLMQGFPGTSFFAAESYVWGYYYEMRKQGKIQGDQEGDLRVV